MDKIETIDIDVAGGPTILGGYYCFDSVEAKVIRLNEDYLSELAVMLTDSESGAKVVVINPYSLVDKIKSCIEHMERIQALPADHSPAQVHPC